MNSKVQSPREVFIQDLMENNFTTFFVATHPKYSSVNPAFRFTPSPVSMAVPCSWSYVQARKRLFEVGELLSVEEAERRNINFVNPALKEFMPGATLPTLRGGIQLLLPSERADSHRHSANAFRVVLEAPDKGAYTAVEGSRIPMHRGDLILTPNWTWHDHHNESDECVIWYDGLDVLMAFWIGATFYEERTDGSGAREYQPILRDADAVTAACGPGLMHRRALYPEHIPVSNNALIYYPYKTARSLLQELADQGAGNPREGILLEYVNPVNNGPVFPSTQNCLRMINPGSTTQTVRRTENIIFLTLEGSVTFHLPEGKRFSTRTNDVTAIPSWVPCRIENNGKQPAVLFSQSDRPVFQALCFYREAVDPA